MKIGDRVNHAEFGAGTIKVIMFEDTKRELIGVEFDVSNSEFHSLLGKCKNHHGYFCDRTQLIKL